MQFLAANKLFVVTNLTPVMEFRRNVADNGTLFSEKRG